MQSIAVRIMWGGGQYTNPAQSQPNPYLTESNKAKHRLTISAGMLLNWGILIITK